MCFEFLLQRTQSLTPPAPEIFFPSGELPEGRAGSESLQLHRCLVESQEEEKVPLSRMPLLPLCQTHCQAAAELGTSWVKSTATQTLTAWEK